MKCDYHMHLEKGLLTLDYLERFWLRAVEQGIDEIGISEHGHNFCEFKPVMHHLGVGNDTHPDVVSWLGEAFCWSLDDYVTLIEKGKTRGWRIKLGLEVDYIPGMEEEIGRILENYPWDYVLGSVHFLGKWAFDFSPEVGWPTADINEAYREYFDTLVEAALSGLFDSITHPDVIKVFGHRPTEPIMHHYEKAAEAFAKAGCCAEINAAGLRRPVGEIYPTPDYLRACRAKGVPITLACDAHYPEHVGSGLDRAIELARDCGYEEVATFDRRSKVMCKLG